MTYDASNPEHVAKAQREDEDRDKDILFVMSEPRGRRFLFSLIHDACHVDRVSLVPGDLSSTGFNEGARSIGTNLVDRIRAATPTGYMKMLGENLSLEEANDG